MAKADSLFGRTVIPSAQLTGEAPMRPREQSRGQEDLFRSRLDQIINMKHALVRLGGQIDWRLIGDKLGEVYADDPGQPPLPTRLMAGMAILKHMHNLSDDEVLLRWGQGAAGQPV